MLARKLLLFNVFEKAVKGYLNFIAELSGFERHHGFGMTLSER